MAILEACVETLEAAQAAEAGGASRIELCANLAEQGTTPDDRLLEACITGLRIPVVAMVRPRPGAFVYDAAELSVMARQVGRARALGAAGIVTGALTPEGAVDVRAMRLLIDAAGPLPVTFHRAFDLAPDRDAALAAVIAVGVARVLTSGGAATASEGMPEIARLVRRAAGRLVVVAGGKVRAANVDDLIVHTGVSEVHARIGTADEARGIVSRLRPPGSSPAP